MTEKSRTPWRMAPVFAAIALLSAPMSGPSSALAQPKPSPAAAAAQSEARPAAGRSYEVTFRQLGALFPLQLRGVQGTGGVQFGVRGDEVVTRARLHLNYAYSPALLPEISHLRVLVNEQVVATIPVPNEQGGQALQRVIDIPTRLIGEFNRLNVELIGHYTMDCEDPAHTSLWANVGNDSRLELSVDPLALANDLAFLPEPFFDRRDSRPSCLRARPMLPNWRPRAPYRRGSVRWRAFAVHPSPLPWGRFQPRAMPWLWRWARRAWRA